MRRGRGDGRAVADRRLQLAQAVLVGGRLRHVELEVAGGRDARRTEVAVARGIGGGLREAEIEPPQQRRDHAGRVAPAIEGALGYAAVDQDQRNAPLRAHQDEVRPEVGFGEQAEVGLPVVEEARGKARRIERNVLMDDAGRQPLARELGGGHRAGGEQDVEFLGDDALDQRDDRGDLADAGAVDPDQRAVRARRARLAAPLGQPRRIFLAALEAVRQQESGQRRAHRRCQPIGAQRKRQPLHCHRPFDDPLGQRTLRLKPRFHSSGYRVTLPDLTAGVVRSRFREIERVQHDGAASRRRNLAQSLPRVVSVSGSSRRCMWTMK